MWDIHQHGAECLLGFWGKGSCIQGSSSDGGADSREIRKGEVTRGGRVSGAVAVLGGVFPGMDAGMRICVWLQEPLQPKSQSSAVAEVGRDLSSPSSTSLLKQVLR